MANLKLFLILVALATSGCSVNHSVSIFVEKDWTTTEYYRILQQSDMKTKLEYRVTGSHK